MHKPDGWLQESIERQLDCLNDEVVALNAYGSAEKNFGIERQGSHQTVVWLA